MSWRTAVTRGCVHADLESCQASPSRGTRFILAGRVEADLFTRMDAALQMPLQVMHVTLDLEGPATTGPCR